MSQKSEKTSRIESQPIVSLKSPTPIEISNPISYIPPDLPNIQLAKHGALDVIQLTNSLIVLQTNEKYNAESGTKKRYIVEDMLRRPILYAFEILTQFERIVVGNRRGTKMEYADIHGTVIMKSERIFPCCDNELRFEYPIGETLGVVTKGACDETLNIRPSIGLPQFQVIGSCCSSFASNYPIIICDGQKVAEIVRLKTGCLDNWLSVGNNFMIHFNPALPAYYKLLVMAAGFLIDFISVDNIHRGNKTF